METWYCTSSFTNWNMRLWFLRPMLLGMDFFWGYFWTLKAPKIWNSVPVVWFYIFFFNTTDIRDQENNIFNLFLSQFLNTVILVWWCVFFKSWADKKKRKQVKSGLFLSWQNKTFESNWKVCYFVSWLSFYSSFFLHL